MDTRTESQLRQELEGVRQTADMYKQLAEFNAAQRDRASALYDHVMVVLSRIHALLYPRPVAGREGRTMVFRPKSPDPHDVLQELSDRIRALPDEVSGLQQEFVGSANPWRPIETVPLDGTAVLVYIPDSYAKVDIIAFREWHSSAWRRAHCTHWMPLPDPPAGV